MIECRDGRQLKAFRCGDDGAQRQIVIDGNQLRDSQPVAGQDRFGNEVSRCKVGQETGLGLPAETRLEEIDDFCHHELRDEERTLVRLEELQAHLMVTIILVVIGV